MAAFLAGNGRNSRDSMICIFVAPFFGFPPKKSRHDLNQRLSNLHIDDSEPRFCVLKKRDREENASESRKVTYINCYNPKKYHVNDMQILFWRHFPENLNDSLLFVVPSICTFLFPGPF